MLWLFFLSTVVVEDTARERLLEIGYGPSYEASLELYAPLLAHAPQGDLEIEKDIAYGPHERNLLDVYRPKDGTGAPVFIFVHGGGYASGDRDLTEHAYGNVLRYFGRNGFVGINVTYRLYPDARWPSGAEDMRALVAWVRKNVGSYGGDPERVFMMGHSAGATHVATYAFDARFQPGDGHGLSGIILVSGRYRLRSDPDDPSLEGIRNYFGDDPAKYASRSALTHLPGSDVPVMIVVAEFDQRNLVQTSGELFVALCERDDGRCPRFLQLEYHNHISEILHINTSDELLGREILDFIREGASRRRDGARAR